MKTICLTLIGVAVLTGCAPEPVVEEHHHYYHSSSGTPSTGPGEPVHLANPGEPDSFKAQGNEQ